MYITTKALVLRSVTYKESSRILTVLTSDHGKLTVSARGAMRKNSRVAACVQPLVFSNMTLSRTHDRYVLTEASVIEQFAELTNDLSRFTLGAYFVELLEAVSDEDSVNPELLSLGLNALYMLCRQAESNTVELIKAAFELRLMCLAGYAPILDCCASCGEEIGGTAALDIEGGAVYCDRCSNGGDGFKVLCPAALQAARFICSCDSKRLYSFALESEPRRRLAVAVEDYILAQLGRRFGSLDYFYSVQ